MENQNYSNTTETNGTAEYKVQSWKSMLCAIYEWFETGHVPLYKYTEKLHYKIWSQGAIGRRQCFNGSISMQHWLELHGNTKTSLGKFQINYIGEASIVDTKVAKENSQDIIRTSLNELILGEHQLETCLRMMIELWDIRNEDIHGKDKATKKQKRIAKISLGQI